MILLRISLILAIVAGIATVVITQTKVREHFQEIAKTRDYNKEQWTKETARADKNKKGWDESIAAFVRTSNNLVKTQGELKQTQGNLEALQAAKAVVDGNLAKETTNRVAAEAKLARWEGLGMQPEQVRVVVADLKSAKDELDTMKFDNGALTRKNIALQTELDMLRGKITEVPLPRGLKGNIVVVDPRWEFVVLDIGGNQGVLPGGIMMVHRDSKLVGKVKITSVLSDKCIANVMPGWKLDDIQEGDRVLY